MSTVWSEGFEYAGNALTFARKYPGSVLYGSFDAGRLLGYGLRGVPSTVGTTVFRTKAWAVDASTIVGFAMLLKKPVSGRKLVRLMSGGVEQAYIDAIPVGLTNDFVLRLFKAGGSPSLLFTTPTIVAGAWNYFEWKLVASTTSGSFDFRRNEVSLGSGAGVATSATVNTVDQVEFQLDHQVGGDSRLDDIVILSATTTFNGDQVIELILPSADGATTDWVPSTGSNHTAMVSETPNPDDDTTYVSTTIDDKVELFSASDLTYISGGITAVMLHAEIRLSSSGSRNVKGILRHSSTIAEGTSQAIDDTSYDCVVQPWDTNPVTAAAWTLSDVNGAQFGVKSVA